MPTPLVFETPDYQSNESLKAFESTDALAKSYLDLDGRVKSGSIELLPEEMRKDPTLSVFKTLPELAKGYVETKKLVGGIEKAPEKPDGYKFTPMANLDPRLKVDVITGQIRNIVHEAGLGNKAADVIQQKILANLSANLVKQDNDRKALILQNETALRQEWGAEYDAKFDKIVNVIRTIGGPEMANETDQIAAALKGSPNFLKGMGKIVGFLSEDSIKALGDGGDKPITDSKAAQEAIAKLNAEINKEGIKHPYYDDRHPDHDKFKKQMEDLFKLAYPT